MIGLFFFVLISYGWEISVDAGLGLNQSYYNDAWSGDEVGSIVWMSLFNLEAKRKLSPRVHLSEVLRLGYGQTYAQDKETGRWNPPQKSTDKVESETILKIKAGWHVDPFFSLLLRSQFIDSRSNLYLNPLEFTESIGLARILWRSKGDELTSRSGFAFKHTLNRGKGRTISYEGGIEIVINSKKKLSKIALYRGKLILFKAMFNSEANSGDAWKTPDFNLQNSLGLSLTTYIQLNFYLEFIYDRDITSRLQVKENFSIGLSYKFF